MPAQRSGKLYLVLCANAVLLALVLASTWARRSAAQQATGGNIQQVMQASVAPTIMPAQLSPQTWGCYLMDPANQTLCVYSFRPGEHELRLEASRDVQYDRQLKQYNTTPPPTQVQRLAAQAATPSGPQKE